MQGIATIIILAVCGACSTVTVQPTQPSAVVPVEIFTGGDDGLTQRLADAIRSEFGRTSQFVLAPSSTRDALQVTIPTHVDWQEVGGKTRVIYQLHLERAGGDLGKSSGECWDENLPVCARKVVHSATIAVSR